MVQYQGYGGGRGLPHQWLYWAAAGYAHLFMDTRGQGSGWSVRGLHPESGRVGARASPGFMTRGIEDPQTFYYYRRVFADAVRAVEDGSRSPSAGESGAGGRDRRQPGRRHHDRGVGVWSPDVAAAMPDVPFLCDFQRAIEITPKDPYTEVVRYLTVHRDKVELR